MKKQPKQGILRKTVNEGRYTINARTGERLHPKTGEPLPAKEKPLTMKQMFAQKPAAKKPAGPSLDQIWRKVEDVVSSVYPDGDPIDHLAPWLEKQGIKGHQVGDVLRKAAVKNGYSDVYDYFNSMGDLYEQGVAEDAGTTWEVNFEYGPHMAEIAKVEASSEEEAIAKVKAIEERRGRRIMINWARPAEQGVAEGLPGGLSSSDYTPGATRPDVAKQMKDKSCKRCNGSGHVWKDDSGKVFTDKKQGTKRYKCGACGGIGMLEEGRFTYNVKTGQKLHPKTGEPLDVVPTKRRVTNPDRSTDLSFDKIQRYLDVQPTGDPVNDFIARGGEVKQGTYHDPRKSEKTSYGSKHIGGVRDAKAGRAGKTLGLGAPTQFKGGGKPIVGEGYDEYEDDDFEGEEDQGFFVAISDEEDGVFIGMLVKEDGKWRERTYMGTPPASWGGTYMSYLTPQDLMQWIRKDYGRNYQVEGPMDEDEAREYADMMREAAPSIKPRAVNPDAKADILSRRKALQAVAMDPETARDPLLRRELARKKAELARLEREAGMAESVYGDDSGDELRARPGSWRSKADMAKRTTKSGKPTKAEQGFQDNLKNRIKMQQQKGGLTGPKGPLPESADMVGKMPRMAPSRAPSSGDWIVKYWDGNEGNAAAERRVGSKAEAQAILDKLPAHYRKSMRPAAMSEEAPAKSEPVEAYGYAYNRKDQRITWRRVFKSAEAAYAWAEKRNATVMGTRPAEAK